MSTARTWSQSRSTAARRRVASGSSGICGGQDGRGGKGEGGPGWVSSHFACMPLLLCIYHHRRRCSCRCIKRANHPCHASCARPAAPQPCSTPPPHRLLWVGGQRAHAPLLQVLLIQRLLLLGGSPPRQHRAALAEHLLVLISILILLGAALLFILLLAAAAAARLLIAVLLVVAAAGVRTCQASVEWNQGKCRRQMNRSGSRMGSTIGGWAATAMQ